MFTNRRASMRQGDRTHPHAPARDRLLDALGLDYSAARRATYAVIAGRSEPCHWDRAVLDADGQIQRCARLRELKAKVERFAHSRGAHRSAIDSFDRIICALAGGEATVNAVANEAHALASEVFLKHVVQLLADDVDRFHSGLELQRAAADLDSNAAKPAREQLTLIRIFEDLRGRGYDAVRRASRRDLDALEPQLLFDPHRAVAGVDQGVVEHGLLDLGQEQVGMRSLRARQPVDQPFGPKVWKLRLIS